MKFSRIVRRVDFLLVALALLLSGVIYLRFAPPVEEAQVIPVLVQDAQTTRSDSRAFSYAQCAKLFCGEGRAAHPQ